MRAQSQIRRTLGTAEARQRVADILAREQFASRRALGRRVCEEFDFRDRRGRPQLAGCLKALSALAARAAEIVLPPPGRGVPRSGQPHVLVLARTLFGQVLLTFLRQQMRAIAHIRSYFRKEMGRWHRRLDAHPPRGRAAGLAPRGQAEQLSGMAGVILAVRARSSGLADQQLGGCRRRIPTRRLLTPISSFGTRAM